MSALLPLVIQVGAPLVRQILTRKIGGDKAELASEVIDLIAARAGVSRPVLEAMAEDNPEPVKDAILEVEAEAPELLALYAQGLEGQFALLQAERQDPIWYRAWRPLGMYFIIFLWLWQIVLLHVLNAYFKIALPPADWTSLVTLTSLYFGLYMGGHTIKDVATKWAARKGGVA